MRSRACGWIMPVEEIPPMLQMIEEKIASSEIEVDYRHSLIRLRHILEDDLKAVTTMTERTGTSWTIREDREELPYPRSA